MEMTCVNFFIRFVKVEDGYFGKWTHYLFR